MARRYVVTVVAVTALSSVLVGCGNDQEKSPAPPRTVATSQAPAKPMGSTNHHSRCRPVEMIAVIAALADLLPVSTDCLTSAPPPGTDQTTEGH